MVKLEFIPANRATDWLIIGNIPALIEEVQALRFGVQDLPTSMGWAQAHHAMAIKLLNQEIGHYMGTQKIAVNFAPFGTANLRRPMSAVRTGLIYAKLLGRRGQDFVAEHDGAEATGPANGLGQ